MRYPEPPTACDTTSRVSRALWWLNLRGWDLLWAIVPYAAVAGVGGAAWLLLTHPDVVSGGVAIGGAGAIAPAAVVIHQVRKRVSKRNEHV